MNQRASHFVLGSSSQNPASVYAKDFGPKTVEPSNWKAGNPFRSSSLSNNDPNNFSTTNKTMLRAWNNIEPAKLSEEKLS